MPNPKTLLLVVTFSVLATSAVAYSESSARIRHEYGGVENTPDHVMFATFLRVMKHRNESDALWSVHRFMKIESKAEAQEFIQHLRVALDDMNQTQRNLDIVILCQSETITDKRKIDKAMDDLDDARLDFARLAYIKFKKTLKGEQKQYFKAWLEDMKEGYSYMAFDHSTTNGPDVLAYAQQRCIELEQARTQ
jgi:hypothetical protein